MAGQRRPALFVPLAVTADRWCSRYPALTPQAFACMDWEVYLQLEAAQYGRSVAELTRRRDSHG